MAKKISYEEAKKAMLRGEIITASQLSSENVTRLRFAAHRLGKEFVDSGIFNYRSYSFS